VWSYFNLLKKFARLASGNISFAHTTAADGMSLNAKSVPAASYLVKIKASAAPPTKRLFMNKTRAENYEGEATNL